MNVTTLGMPLIVSFLRLYKAMYVVFVSRLEDIVKEAFVLSLANG